MYVNVPWVDTNTTYSVGDGGLTQNNFTDALKSKLNGIAASANNYSLPLASSSTRGGVKIGYSENGKNYPVELSSEKMYVNVPWTDTNTNTTYAAGSGLNLSSTTFSHSDTSSQSSINNSNGSVIQDVTLDTFGHVTGLSSTNLDSRYYTESEVTNHFKTLGVQGNYMNTYGWSGDTSGSAPSGWSSIGTAPFNFNGDYGQNGAEAENTRSVETLPNGAKGVVWQTPSNDASSDADGGWNCTINGVDSTKGYRSVIYFRPTDDSNSGTFYHGCSGSHTLNINGSVNSNPYFKSQSYSSFVQDRWYVSIGYIQPYQSSGATTSGQGGIYDCTTGKKVFGANEFMMKNGSTIQQHRTYLYYSVDQNTSIDFYGPRFEEVNGNEPSIQELVNKGLDGLGAMSFHSKYDPEALSELNESTDATTDKIFLWDESGSEWKYMTLDNLQDSINTDTNTTYSVGDNGLTERNFTSALKSKLDGIASNANNYSLPVASSSTRGGVKIGYPENGKYYPVELSNEKMYVHVPWSDTNTTYSVGDGGLTQKNFTTTLKNKLDGIESGAKGDQTASEILTAIKTVDGSSSGLDADKLDGYHASTFYKSGSNASLADVTITDANSKIDVDGTFGGDYGSFGIGTTNLTNGHHRIFAKRTDHMYFAASSSKGFRFRPNGGTSSASGGVTITSAGRLGVGTTSLSSKLAVNGGVAIGASYTSATAPTNGMLIQGNVGIGTSSVSGYYALQVNGSIQGSYKSFVIDHPTKENKQLVHASLEGPEIGVYFRGKSTSNTITMPDYWGGLVDLDSMTVELTAIGANQCLFVDSVESNGDVVVGSNTDEPLNYFYVVYGERKDIDKLAIEVDIEEPEEAEVIEAPEPEVGSVAYIESLANA